MLKKNYLRGEELRCRDADGAQSTAQARHPRARRALARVWMGGCGDFSYDMGILITVLVFGYLGTTGHRPRLLVLSKYIFSRYATECVRMKCGCVCVFMHICTHIRARDDDCACKAIGLCFIAVGAFIFALPQQVGGK